MAGAPRTRPPVPALAAGVMLACISAVAIGFAGPQREAAGLDAEHTVAGYLSGALLVLAGAVTWWLAAAWGGRPGARAALVVLGAFLGFLALDEVLAVHERVEARAGVDWQLLYLPVALVGATAGLVAAYALRRRRLALTLLITAGLAWAAALLLEDLQWDGDVLAHPSLVYYEELLEMGGSALIVVAMLLAREASAPPRRTGDASRVAPVRDAPPAAPPRVDADARRARR